MTISSRERGQILILLATWLLFGGSASSALIAYDRPASEMKKAVKQVIPAGDPREVILFDIGQWEAGQKKQDEAVSADREGLLKALRRKDTQRSQLEPLLAKLDGTFLAMDRNFLDLRFRVKQQVTSAQWTEIVARPDR